LLLLLAARFEWHRDDPFSISHQPSAISHQPSISHNILCCSEESNLTKRSTPIGSFGLFLEFSTSKTNIIHEDHRTPVSVRMARQTIHVLSCPAGVSRLFNGQ
jgi:hypothetical protein